MVQIRVPFFPFSFSFFFPPPRAAQSVFFLFPSPKKTFFRLIVTLLLKKPPIPITSTANNNPNALSLSAPSMLHLKGDFLKKKKKKRERERANKLASKIWWNYMVGRESMYCTLHIHTHVCKRWEGGGLS